MRAPRPPRRPRSLAGQLFVMQVVLVTVLVAGCAVYGYVTDRAQAEESARQRAAATAKATADSPSVVEAIRTPRPEEQLQPHAERVRHDTGVTFVTIMDTEGVRWTHPDSSRIGGRFVGHIGQAARGRTFHETYTGTLGPSVRVVTPVWDEGRVVGLVSAGIAVETITEELRRELTVLLCVAGGALALGGLGTYLINARLRRHTHGMNAAELSRMHDYHQAVLHAVREGLVMLDGQKRVALMNDGARELLGAGRGGAGASPGPDGGGSGDGAVGRGVEELGLPRALTEALLSGEPHVDEVHLTGDRVVVVNTSPVDGGERRGTVVTLRDHTEIQSLAGELDSVRGFTEALRSQAHESANRLHTVISLIELGRTGEALDFATEELRLAQALTDEVVSAVAEPVVAALLLGKAAQANERGVELSLTPDSHIGDGLLPPELPQRDLVTVLGNLVDNAVDAAAAGGPVAGSEGGRGAGPSPAETEPAAGRRPEEVPEAEGAGSGGTVATLPLGSAVTPRVRVTLRTETVEGGADVLLVRVGDTGPGVPPEDAETVFERGWSTKPASGGERGRGLGLALVRQVADRHGGSVHVGASAEGGAEFSVRLPLQKDAPPGEDPHGDRHREDG
ncbi:Sensor histidine kinase regulating citrate/malate metabolism [Streptomyces sp. WMMB 714]|uniref:sensor histidine kinase n=1 Tax=Streptomyces sp. WMMB 714 TaxID=1286822 RepID=UPI0005F7977C|nr:ATP-binding protein [Streptomyces sp. WMMB 714]SCK35262.1 Sensor histidine kinase regulating citrate/malate metabolism [Streptomyces sp. WMMB 714]